MSKARRAIRGTRSYFVQSGLKNRSSIARIKRRLAKRRAKGKSK